MMKLADTASPCAISPTPPRHACSTWHATMVAEYRIARHAYVLDREAATGGWATEMREYDATHRAVTFRAWLEGTAGRNATLDGDDVEPLTAQELAELATIEGW